MYKIITILVLFFIIYYNSCEGIQFSDPGMLVFYKKNNIIYDKKRQRLIKDNKIVDISNGLNGEKKYSNKDHMKLLFKINQIPTSKWYIWKTSLHTDKNIELLKKKNLKFPLVIKPYDTYGGINVVTDIYDIKKMIMLINNLSYSTDAFIIEEQVIGETYRIFLFNGYILDIYKIEKPMIVGDGKATINKLIDTYMNNPEIKLSKYQIDYDLILSQGYYANSVLPKNKKIIITNVCNSSIGSKSSTINKKNIHPANIELFKKVARIVNLNVCGIDYITTDIGVPYYKYGSIIEVNSKPGIKTYIKNNPNVINKLLKNIFK